MNETLNIQNGVSPITIDTEVTEGSMRPVMGGGIYEAITAVAEPFIVELTPTSSDLTAGTMNKTAGEITAAWQAGKRIEFRIAIAGAGEITLYCSNVSYVAGYEYPSFEVTFAQSFTRPGVDSLSHLSTGRTNNAEQNVWYADHYLLQSE